MRYAQTSFLESRAHLFDSLDEMGLWQPPPLGTLIDFDSLKLVEVLRAGHYEVVYRAIDVLSHPSKSYIIKCRAKAINQTPSQRLLHTREITLHRLASGQPSIATLYRVLEDLECDFMVLDYSPDRDLLFQITSMRRYLGNDGLIKQVFLQILDAVEHCHAIGIYHRTIHPGNISCFDHGRRVAINNFRGATINALSTGFRQGVAYSAPGVLKTLLDRSLT
jgi:serine/threonine protein kinase